jgi:hypothetical protein
MRRSSSAADLAFAQGSVDGSPEGPGTDFNRIPESRQGPAFYREQAKVLGEMAEKARTGEHRENLLKIALDYERLPGRVEKMRRLRRLQVPRPIKLSCDRLGQRRSLPPARG